eukprot:595977-Prymnesium_polylepis.1
MRAASAPGPCRHARASHRSGSQAPPAAGRAAGWRRRSRTYRRQGGCRARTRRPPARHREAERIGACGTPDPEKSRTHTRRIISSICRERGVSGSALHMRTSSSATSARSGTSDVAPLASHESLKTRSTSTLDSRITSLSMDITGI